MDSHHHHHLSFVSRARTALHSAAAKAEKVLTDIKADLRSDRETDGQYHKGVKTPADQAAGGADASDKAQVEIRERESTGVEQSSNCIKHTVIPVSVLRQLAAAIVCGRNYKSIKDLLTLVVDPSSVKEKTGLKFSTVKALVLREKDDKSNPDYGGDEEFHSVIHFLFHSEEPTHSVEIRSSPVALPMMYLSKDIHSAPPESFIVRLSEVIGGFKSLQKMASFWLHVVGELRRLWSEGQPISHVPLEANPDLNSCLLHQQLQVINCCIARKRRRILATESLDSTLKEATLDNEGSNNIPGTNCVVYARTNSGHNVLRLGADHPSENLTMLETGEPIYSPVTQEGAVLTEELIKETEEFVLRTGSLGAGCSQLLSDMQAFKAANPGCVLEDFIRWHSPPDWRERDLGDEMNFSSDAEGSSSRRGQLSRRMQKEGNLWRELWGTAKPLPAVRQTPLFDEDLVVEGILNTLEDIAPCKFFEQLFLSVLSSGFLIAEAALPADTNLSKLFYDCRDYIIAIYQNGTPNENLANICNVYETVEKIMTHPEEVIQIVDQQQETASEHKNRFKKISLHFLGKDRQASHKKTTKDERDPEEKQWHVFSHLFDKRTSLFSKKHPKPSATLPAAVPSGLDECEWTVV